jgi:hypothetical protein
MPLAIDTLAVRCRAAPEHRDVASDIEHWTRRSFESSLAAHLGPSLDRLTGIHIIRRLEVRLRLTSRDWTQSRFLESACQAFSEALFRTLALPASADPSQRAHYEGSITWHAAFIRWLALRDRSHAWHFDLPPELSQLETKSAALLVLLEEPASIVELLRCLHIQGTLAHLAAQWDDLALERVFLGIGNTRLDQASSVPQLGTAFDVLRTAVRVHPPRGTGFASRQHALLVFAAAAFDTTPRTVFHILQAARLMLENARATSVLAESGQPEGITAWRRTLESASHSSEWQSIVRQLAQTHIAIATTTSAESEWIRSDNAGVFLLAPMVLALGWRPAPAPREFESILAAIFQSTLTAIDPLEPRFDPAASLAAGLGIEPSVADIRAFLAAVRLQDICRAWHLDPVRDWPAFLQQARAKLLRELGSRVRGFRQAQPDAIARAFIKIPGRIEVTEDHIRVVIVAAPYLVALHISGCDGDQPAIPWLTPRTVTLLLEGI